MLEKAKAHFKLLVEHEGLRCIEVPEWGEVNCPGKIYFRPSGALPINVYSRLVALGSQQTVESFVDILILRSLDEQGQPLFKRAARTEMVNEISPLVVCDIIKKMGEQDKLDNVPTFEEMEKN